MLAKAVVDATGRDALLASKLGQKKRDPDLNKIAIYTYFKGAKRDPGIDAGATTVAYIAEKGWFWYIPLANDVVSVGVVAEADYLYRETRDPEEVFCREATQCAWIEDHITLGPTWGRSASRASSATAPAKFAGDGFCLAGDAFSFLDPVFSSGVFLALKSGEMAADAIHEGLAQHGRVTASTFRAYERDFRWALDRFRQLVLAFYNESSASQTSFALIPISTRSLSMHWLATCLPIWHRSSKRWKSSPREGAARTRRPRRPTVRQ